MFKTIPGELLAYILLFLEDTSPANLAKKLIAVKTTCKACTNDSVVEQAALFHIELHKTNVFEALRRENIESLFDDIWNPVIIAGKKKSWTFALWCMIPIVGPHGYLSVYIRAGRTGLDPGQCWGGSTFQIPTKISRGQIQIIYGRENQLSQSGGYYGTSRSSFVDWFKTISNIGILLNKFPDTTGLGLGIFRYAPDLKLHPGCFKRTIGHPPGFVCNFCHRYKRSSPESYQQSRGHYAWQPNKLEILRCPLLESNSATVQMVDGTMKKEPFFTSKSLANVYAFLLGKHSRAGSDSLVKTLPKDLVRKICDFVREPLPDSYLLCQLKEWVTLMEPGEIFQETVKRNLNFSEVMTFLRGRFPLSILSMKPEQFMVFFKVAHRIKCMCGIVDAILRGKEEVWDDDGGWNVDYEEVEEEVEEIICFFGDEDERGGDY